MSDFSDAPLIAGSLIGERSFGRTPGGTLTGAVYKSINWERGVNRARCVSMAVTFANLGISMDLSMKRLAWQMNSIGASMRGEVYLVKRPKAPAPKPREPHRLAGKGCTCGFYAYFDSGNNPHHSTGNVIGLIEGYGTVTVGSRGFRAEKAEIKALIVPYTHRVTKSYVLMRRMYPDIPVFPTRELALAAFPMVPPPRAEEAS